MEQESNEAQDRLDPKRVREGRHIEFTWEIPMFEPTDAEPSFWQLVAIGWAGKWLVSGETQVCVAEIWSLF